MNDSTRSASAGRGTARWLMAMTVAEVALAIMLVAGAGWLVRGFSNLRNTKAGFVTDKRLLFDVSFLGPRYPTPAAVQQAHVDLMTAVRSVRGVTDVGLVSAYPTRGRLEGSLLAHFMAKRSTRPIRQGRGSASPARDSSPQWAPRSSRVAISEPGIARATQRSRLSTASSSTATSRDAIRSAFSFRPDIRRPIRETR